MDDKCCKCNNDAEYKYDKELYCEDCLLEKHNICEVSGYQDEDNYWETKEEAIDELIEKDNVRRIINDN